MEDKKATLTFGGGIGEVGRSHALYEFGNHVLILDCGIKPRSPEEREKLKAQGEEDLIWSAPDYPDLGILDQKLKEGKEISALITHGHLDHIGGISKLIERGIPICLSNWTRRYFTTRYADSAFFPEGYFEKAKFITFPRDGHIFQFGDFMVKCFPVEHSIPDTFGVLIKVGGKNILHLTDFKFNGLHESRSVLENRLLEIKKECGEIDCLVMDVLNSDMDGFTPPEELVINNLEEIIKESQGRVFITFFSSNIQRFGEIMKVCKKLHRPVRVLGQGMRITHQEFLDSIDGNKRISRRQAGKSKARPFIGHSREVVLLAGCQGEDNSHIWKCLFGGWLDNNGKFRKSEVTISRKDTMAFSSRAIPGSEKSIYELIENIYRRTKKIILHEGESRKLELPFGVEERPVHFSGHEYRGGQQKVIEIIGPRMILPVHAEPEKIKLFTDFLGRDSERVIIPSLGKVISI